MNILGIEHLAKRRRIKRILLELDSRLPGLELCDYWDADLSAVGIAFSSEPSLLIYVSCWRRSAGQVDYSIEKHSTEVERADDVPMSQLIAAIQKWLDR